MQEELMKVLQSRKLNTSVVLNLKPEKPLLTKSENEITMLAISQYQRNTDVNFSKSGDLSEVNYLFLKHLARKGEINNVGLTILPFFKLFNFNLHKGKVTPGLLKLPADQSNMLALANLQHMDWANESELKKLYILANLLAVELQEKIYNAEKSSGTSKIKPALKSFLTTPTMHKSQAHGTEWQSPAVLRHLKEHLKTSGICQDLAEQCDKILSRNKHGRKKIPERTKECVDYMMKCTREEKKGKSSKKVKRETLQAKEQRSKGTLRCFSRKRRETKKAVKSQMQKQSDSDLHLVAQKRKKVSRSLNPSSALSVFKHPKISMPSSRRRSLPYLSTQASPMAVSFKVENNSDDLTGKIVIFLEHANKTDRKKDLDALKAKYVPTGQPKNILIFQKHGQKGSPQFSRNNLFQKAFHRANSDVSHMLVERKQKHRINSKDDVINSLSHRKSVALTDAVLENPSENKDSLLDGILPSIRQTNETHWKHQKETSGFLYALSGSSSPDNYSVQGDLFEAELNNRLRSLIPNQAVRNLISHVIRTLKMDCTEPRVQLACAKLISKTGLLMKLFSEREDIKETSSLWKMYLWENRNAPNESTHQRKAGVKDSEEEPPQYSYGNKLLLAISVTVVIMIIIAVICLIEICSQRSAASSQSTHDNKPQPIWSFKKLSRERKSKTSSEVVHQVPRVSESSDMEKPLWLRDMYLPLDSIRKKSMAQKLYDKESSDEEEIFNRADLKKQYEWSSSKESY
uniref:LRRC37A/B like protein 1 C-terminal domain-containing protein n=1 Tax=Pelusios castaneus TaxID=367368 RepID=A0A8C8SUN5_9SAUR